MRLSGGGGGCGQALVPWEGVFEQTPEKGSGEEFPKAQDGTSESKIRWEMASMGP